MFGVEFNGKGDELSKQPKLSKQVIDIWHSVFEPERGWVQRSSLFLFVCVIHSWPFFVPDSWFSASRESTPKTEAVRIRITENKTNSGTEESQKLSAEKQPSVKRSVREQPQPKILTSSDPSTDPSLQNKPINVPEIPIQPQDQDSSTNEPGRTEPSSIDAKTALPKEVVSPLLPSGKDDFIARQRQLGEVIGAGAIAGDLEILDVVSEKDPSQPITRTEYTFAGYFDSLSRRFVEAWGGTRTLPPESRFEGKIGEFIEYDIVINRDGSLRKIVNITAKREPYRDFAAVDDLVVGVFKTMFPFQPVPARIRNDPLVIRKRIQFVGFKYRLY